MLSSAGNVISNQNLIEFVTFLGVQVFALASKDQAYEVLKPQQVELFLEIMNEAVRSLFGKSSDLDLSTCESFAKEVQTVQSLIASYLSLQTLPAVQRLPNIKALIFRKMVDLVCVICDEQSKASKEGFSVGILAQI